MADLQIVVLDAAQTHPLRLTVLRDGTPSTAVTFDGDDLPGTLHLGLRRGDELVAVSTWIPNPHHGEAAVQLRGMATAPHLQGLGFGAALLEEGCERARAIASLVWARARDTALPFYLHHGFSIEGDGFVDATTALPHHVIVRRLSDP